MSDRTIRRAAERKARKVAARQQKRQHSEQNTAATQSKFQPRVMTASAGATAAPSILNVGVTDNATGDTETITGTEPAHRQASEAQLAANRANAQKSTGPVTPRGRANSSLNAVRTGLTGQTVLLPTDDAAAYQAHLDRHFKRHAPANDEEHTLVQMIADAEWRILRIPGLEASIHAIGRQKLAGLHPEPSNGSI